MANYIIQDMIANKNISIKHSTNANLSHTITNKSKQNLLMVVTLNAGSGDINDTTRDNSWLADDITQYYDTLSLAGNKGTTINLKKGSTLLATAEGGSGNLADVISRRQRRNNSYWKDDSGNKTYRGWGSWYDTQNTPNAHKIARKGQVVFYPLILKDNESINIDFIHNKADKADFKGSVYIDFLYYIIPTSNTAPSKAP